MAPFSPQRTLVIDDDPVMRELLFALLSAKGHTVALAEDGDAALAQLHEGLTADVVLTDIQLPGLSGPALAKELHAAAPAAMLLGMSGSQPPKRTRSAFHGFLLKPFSTDDFEAAITRAERAALATEPSGLSARPALDETTYHRLAAALPADRLSELYELTLTDIDSRLDRLREASVAQDVAAWRREAHALKGGVSMVGAAELAHLAAKAETAGAGSFLDTPAFDLPAFDTPATALSEFTSAAERLRNILSARFIHNGNSRFPGEPHTDADRNQ